MIPVVSLQKLVPNNAPVENHGASADGNVSDYELEVINQLVTHNRPAVIFEIGTFDGRTSLNMAANSSDETRVYTLDLPASKVDDTALPLAFNEHLYINKPVSGARFLNSPLRKKITQLLGDSATFDFTPYHNAVDFMFVDGSHSYEYVINDTIAALKMVSEGGIIIWHDFVREGYTAFPGVPNAMKEFYLSDDRFHGLAQIEGASMLYLKVPPKNTGAGHSKILTGDSSSPDHLNGQLSVSILNPSLIGGRDINIRVQATNTGSASWLPSNVLTGAVRLGTHLLNTRGASIQRDYWRNNFPFHRTIFPGETVVFDDSLVAPDAGEYILNFDLVADGVAWFDIPVKLPVTIL